MKLKKKVGRQSIELTGSIRNEKGLTARLNPRHHEEDDKNNINDSSSDSMMENSEPINSGGKSAKKYAGMAPLSEKGAEKYQQRSAHIPSSHDRLRFEAVSVLMSKSIVPTSLGIFDDAKVDDDY